MGINFTRLCYKNRTALINNPHFWAIIFTILTLAYTYYANFFSDNRWLWFWYLEVFEFKYDLHGSLFYIPVLYAVSIFWWRGAAITWLISITIILPRILYFVPDNSSLVSNIIFLLVPLVIVGSINMELKWREKERKALVDREIERQTYMSRVFKAQEDERKRLAQELHDDTTQMLLVIANHTQNIVTDEIMKVAPHIREKVEWVRDSILNLSDDVRRLSLDLRPNILDNMGLVPALRWLVDGLNGSNGISAQIEIKGTIQKLSPETDVIIFRIIQEALNNIRRHSEAKEAGVTLEFALQSVKIDIWDNGKGFYMPGTISDLAALGKLGIVGMQERARFLEGTFNIRSEIGKGTFISILAPINPK